MPDITIQIPSIGTEGYFTFKEPINYYIRNKFNLNTSSVKLKVVSIISMKDTIRSDLRDPYGDLYLLAGISEVDYKKDLLDDVSIISFTFKDSRGIERFVRSPINYIESISSITNIEYINKLILIDLNKLPNEVDTTIFFEELKDFIETRLGILPNIKEVSVGSVELVDNIEHETRETIRKNMVTVYKTLNVKLEEITLKYDQILERLNNMNITLG